MRTKNPALFFSLKGSAPQILMAILAASLFLFLSARIAHAADTAIYIENAIRGQTYIKTTTIANPENGSNRIMVSSGGNISEWIGFYDNPDSILPIAFVALPAESVGIITVKITIPEDAPDGDYKGNITTAIATEDITGLILPRTVQEVKIHVGNKKIIAFDAFITPKNSTVQKGNILAIKTIYKNRSNIRISPSLEIKIKKGEKTVYSAIFPYPENRPHIIPNLALEIPNIEISTEDFEPGEYAVSIKASEDEDNGYYSNKEFGFKVIDDKNEKYYADGSVFAGMEGIFSGHDDPPPLSATIPAALGAYAIFITSKKSLSKLKTKLKYILFRSRTRKTKDD